MKSLTLLSILFSLSILPAHATENSDWSKWVEANRKDLAEEYSAAAAVDLIHLDPKSKMFVVPRGEGGFEFAKTERAGRLASIEWDGKNSFTLQKASSPAEKVSMVKGDSPHSLKLSRWQVKEGMLIDGFKRPSDKYAIVFLYDLKRADLASARQFKTFAYDPAYKMKTSYRPLAKPEPALIAATRGEPKKWQKFGVLAFKLNGHDEQLEIIGPDAESKSPMLMFKDLSNGDQTYAGGRFLNLSLPKAIKELKDGDNVDVDFNFSENPICARSAAFMCPVPRDRLSSKVLAGEQKVH